MTAELLLDIQVVVLHVRSLDIAIEGENVTLVVQVLVAA